MNTKQELLASLKKDAESAAPGYDAQAYQAVIAWVERTPEAADFQAALRTTRTIYDHQCYAHCCELKRRANRR